MKPNSRITKRFIVELSWTDRQILPGTISAMLGDAVDEMFANDEEVVVEKVGLMNNVLGIEIARRRRE